MLANDAIRTMLQKSGLSTVQAAERMGRSKGYFGQYLSRNSVPGVRVMVEIADALGFDMILRQRSDGTELIIDPPEE